MNATKKANSKKPRMTKKMIIRLLLVLAGLLIAVPFFAPVLGGIFNIGSIVGLAASAALILFGAAFDKTINIVKNIRKSKKGRIAFNSVMTIATVLGLCFAITLGSVALSAQSNADGQKVVIILGCQVRGETPSLLLRRRIMSTYDYMLKNEDCVAILSGGQGSGERISEAECMRRLLVEKGIDESRLYIEDMSTSTDENIENSKKIIEENNLSTDVAIATSDFHLKRATMIAEKHGLTPTRISSDSGFYGMPVFFVRDALGVVKEFIFR